MITKGDAQLLGRMTLMSLHQRLGHGVFGLCASSHRMKTRGTQEPDWTWSMDRDMNASRSSTIRSSLVPMKTHAGKNKEKKRRLALRTQHEEPGWCGMHSDSHWPYRRSIRVRVLHYIYSATVTEFALKVASSFGNIHSSRIGFWPGQTCTMGTDRAIRGVSSFVNWNSEGTLISVCCVRRGSYGALF